MKLNKKDNLLRQVYLKKYKYTITLISLCFVIIMIEIITLYSSNISDNKGNSYDYIKESQHVKIILIIMNYILKYY